MSGLLNSGKVGILNKGVNSNTHIFNRWYMFLDGLDKEIAMKTALSFEIAAHMMLVEQLSYDMCFKMTGKIIGDDNIRFETLIFPIIRRIVSKTPEACEYTPEIINISKKEYNTVLCKGIYSGNESAISYFYDTVLPKWSEWHKDREFKTYNELKYYHYNKHKNLGGNEPYKNFIPFDWEAEYCAYVADKVETIIKEYIKHKEDETS